MARTKFVTIATFLTPDLAHLARARLDAEGIAAFLENESAVGMVGLFSNAVGGVKLQVDEPDVERAAEILGLEREDLDPSAPRGPAQGAWICDQCGEEVEANFDLCWSCGAARPENPRPAPSTDGTASLLHTDERPALESAAVHENFSPSLPQVKDENPYRSPQSLVRPEEKVKSPDDELEDEPVQDETPEQLVLRAYRAAIFGLLFSMCAGALNLYSIYVLAQVGSPSQLSAPMRTRYFVALAIDLVVATIWGMVVFGGFIYELVSRGPNWW